MRIKLGLLIALFLGGCSDQAKSNDILACQNQADRFYQGYNNADMSSPRSKYIVACMAARGYAFEVSPADCDSRHALATQPACYISEGWIASLTSRFRNR